MMRLKRASIIRVWIGVLSGLALAPVLHAQLQVDGAEKIKNSLVAFVAEEQIASTNTPNSQALKFDSKIDFRADDRLIPEDEIAVVVSDSIDSFRKNSLVLPNFSEGLIESLLPTSSSPFRFELGDTPPIPEPSTYGVLGTLILSALVLLHRIRDRSAALAV